MTIMLLGAPGSGKGTQAEKITDRLQIPVISTGEILRGAIREGTEVGLKAKSYVDAGQLAPDSVILEIVKERLAQDDCKAGYIMDGFPRTIPQAEALEEMGLSPDVVLAIHVPDTTIEARMTGRRSCPGCGATYHVLYKKPAAEGVCDSCGDTLVCRADDHPETVRARLVTYHEQSEPLMGFYERLGKLRSVTGAEKVDETTKLVFEALDL